MSAFTRVLRPVLFCLLVQVSAAHAGEPAAQALAPEAVPDTFIELLTGESGETAARFDALADSWHPGMVPMALETLRLSRQRSLSLRLISLLEEQTGERHGSDIDAWYRWLWSLPEERHPHYASFKSRLYQLIDPTFGAYFDDARDTRIRLDEVRWGGVVQDGIPPLRQPDMITAADADYLEDEHVVFGVAINGDARAYPKRILAWHEMFVDSIGGTEVAGVYCTLCGALILYETTVDETRHALGTSGFLYRSNKVMYDQATQSLWNTTWGEPVVGPLVGQDIRLPRSHVVTTTWGEWRRRHPSTSVLSLDTGYDRDYGEGVAYRDYFATDELMFTVPANDDRQGNTLANKAEVLALQFPVDRDASAGDSAADDTLAISAEFLAGRPVYHDQVGAQTLVVLTDGSGANRVYDAAGLTFSRYDGDDQVIDEEGGVWQLSESGLEGPDGQSRARLPAHRAFWFGWQAAFRDTRLVM